MEFFGITNLGPQNYIKDIMKDKYAEPYKKEDVELLLKRIEETTYPSLKSEKPDVTVMKQIDCYIGSVDGFAYGSILRFIKMKRKGVIKPVGPCDMYRFPPTTAMEYGWCQHDPELLNKDWYITSPRYPQPVSPNSLILEIARKNNKYATLF